MVVKKIYISKTARKFDEICCLFSIQNFLQGTAINIVFGILLFATFKWGELWPNEYSRISCIRSMHITQWDN